MEAFGGITAVAFVLPDPRAGIEACELEGLEGIEISAFGRWGSGSGEGSFCGGREIWMLGSFGMLGILGRWRREHRDEIAFHAWEGAG